jgi:heat shock protein HslJ
MLSTLPGTQVVVRFDGGELSGLAGCNSFTGSYEISGRTIAIDPLATTMMACEQAIMDQETNFLANLQNTATYSVTIDRLLLVDDQGRTLLNFHIGATESLQDQTWIAGFIGDGEGGLTPVIPGSEITAVFASDGSLRGNAGCNQYNSSYEATAESIAIIEPIATTRMVCDDTEGVMEQESAYLLALESAVTWEIFKNQFNLADAEGNIVVQYKPGLGGEEGTTDSAQSLEPTQVPAVASTLTEETLFNLSYQVVYTESGQAQLVEGEYRQPAAEGSAAETIIKLSDQVAFTELEDGSQAAAVILISSTGGSGVFYDLALVVEQGGEPVNIATTMIGDRIRVTSLEFEGDTIVVEMITQGEDEPMCCPTEWARVSYQLITGGLTQTNYQVLGNVLAPELMGITWKWVEFQAMNDDLTVVENPESYTASFNPDDTISVRADCNFAGGDYRANAGEISIQVLSMTLAACEPDSRGDEFIDLLNQSASYIIEEGFLHISLPMDGGILKLKP